MSLRYFLRNGIILNGNGIIYVILVSNDIIYNILSGSKMLLLENGRLGTIKKGKIGWYFQAFMAESLGIFRQRKKIPGTKKFFQAFLGD